MCRMKETFDALTFFLTECILFSRRHLFYMTKNQKIKWRKKDMKNEKIHNKWVILGTVLIMTVMGTLDSSICNVALPVIQEEMKVSMAGIEWVTSIYLIVTIATILICGKMGDIYGKVKVFQTGVILFTLGSLLCSLSHSLGMLILSRVVQALGQSAALANNQGIITETFPGQQRGRALGMVASSVALGTMLGPTIGGAILSFLPWNFIFIINVPIGILSFVLGVFTLPRRKPASDEKLEISSCIFMILSMFLIFSALILMQTRTNGWTIGMLAAGMAMLILFLTWQTRSRYPLIPMYLFKNKWFTLNIAALVLIFIAIGTNNMILPFYFQDARGFSPGLAGMLMTVISVAMMIVGPISGAWSDKIGCERPTLIGLILFCTAHIIVSMWKITTPLWLIVSTLLLNGIGNGLFQSPNNSLIMGSVERKEYGFAGSLSGLGRYMGMVIGITFSTSLLYHQMSVKAGRKVVSYVEGRPDLFLFGMRAVYIGIALILFAGVILTLSRYFHRKSDKF